MSRQLRDRLAEAIRRSRIGLSRPLYEDLPAHAQDDYLKSADALISLGSRELGFTISDDREGGQS